MKSAYILAFLQDNFGDDLFVRLLCERYPNTAFYTLGPHKSKKHWADVQNLKYVSDDIFLGKVAFKLWAIACSTLNTLCHKNRFQSEPLKYRLEKYLVKISDCAIFIEGSGFMNYGPINEREIKKREIPFYAQHPYLLGCNFGPYIHDEYRSIYEELFAQAEDICFRDSYSRNLFRKLQNARNELDIAFQYNMGEQNLKALPEHYTLISVANISKDNAQHENEKAYITFLQKCVQYLTHKNQKIVFLGLCKSQKDHIIVQEVVGSFKDSIQLYNYPDVSIQQIAAIFQKADDVIATRYHAMIMAILYQKTVYTICYNEKLVHELNDIDSAAPSIAMEELQCLTADEMFKTRGYRVSSKRLKEIIASAGRQFIKLDRVLS